MDILSYLAFFLVSLVILVCLDIIWISVVMKRFYVTQYSPIARMEAGSLKPKILPGLLVWMLIVLGLTLFVLPKILAGEGGIHDFIWGGLLGLVIYGVFDLTNYSVLKNWSFRMTVVDIVWGTSVCGITSWISGFIARFLW